MNNITKKNDKRCAYKIGDLVQYHQKLIMDFNPLIDFDYGIVVDREYKHDRYITYLVYWIGEDKKSKVNLSHYGRITQGKLCIFEAIERYPNEIIMNIDHLFCSPVEHRYENDFNGERWDRLITKSEKNIEERYEAKRNEYKQQPHMKELYESLDKAVEELDEKKVFVHYLKNEIAKEILKYESNKR